MKLLDRKKVNPLSPVFTGSLRNEPIAIQFYNYNKDKCHEDSEYSVSQINAIPDDGSIHWINVHGIHEPEAIVEISNKLGIHQLAVQDILDVNQRPKFQEYDNHWFFTLKSVLPTEGSEINLEQISFILGKNYLISFQERKADYFDHIRERIRKSIGIVRERGADFLLYLMLESILDNYFKTLNGIDDSVKAIMISEQESPAPSILNKIEAFKSEVHQIKKTIIPIRDFILIIEREGFDRIEDRHVKYYFELKDLCMTLIDQCEQMEVKLESNVNLYFSIQGHKMNQVMKTLTVVATVFIPLTFIVGIYGMNFTNMPELSLDWGYPAVWGLMIVVTFGMFYFFKKKGWF